MQKKGQLTLFAIVGIILLIIFAFLFFSVQTISKAKLQQQAEQNFNQVLQSSALNFYVTQCAEKALNDGLKVIGSQGGRIYRGQGGPYFQDALTFMEDGKQENISYAIKRDETVCASTPPEYPCLPNDTVCQNPLNFGPPAFCAFTYPNQDFYKYSLNQLPPLCKSAADCSFESRYCPAGAPACASRSLQGQLEAYVSNKTAECVQIDKVAALNNTFKLTKGNVSTNISIGDVNVVAIVNFPIKAEFQGLPAVTKINQFSATSPIRLKKVYEFADDLIKQNTEKLDFSIINDAGQSQFGNSQFYLTKFENVRDFDDVYRINDTARVIYGQNFIFQFAAQDRFPVLNYVGGTLNSRAPIQTDCGEFDIIAVEGQDLNLTPEGFDTDDDNLSLNYSGWRQDYNETHTLGKGQGSCPTISSTLKTPATSERWTDSNEYRQTKWNASIHLGRKDIGPHEFIVNISDGEFYDWQLIRVLIQDLFNVSAGARSNYTRLGCTNCISVEDPIFLEGEVEQIYSGGGYAFNWTDRTLNNLVLGTDQNLQLPTQAYTINDIKGTLTGQFQTQGGTTHRINLTVTQNNLQASKEFDMRIYECLPYRNPNSDSYPYNSVPDPFFGSHNCCDAAGGDVTASNWGTILGTGTACFSKATFGSIKSFDNARYGTQTISPTYKDITGSPISDPNNLNPNYGNDIFKRNFTQYCKGDRGNTCEGNKIEERIAVTNCVDKGTGEVLRCSGPPTSYLSVNSETDAKPNCAAYTNTTFEKLVGITNSRICNQNSKCAAGEGTSFSAGTGPYLCNATCGNGGCNYATQCIDCNKFNQNCTDTDGGVNYAVQGTVTGIDSSGCSSSACTSGSYTHQDSCQGTILTEYSCPPNSDAQDQPFTQTNHDCRNSETPATGDTDDSPTTIGTCTDGDINAACSSGKCALDTSHVAHQESCNPSGTTYVFTEYVATDNGVGIDSKCMPKSYDPDDTSANICKNCNNNFEWLQRGYSGNFGGYVAGRTMGCCGDDTNESIQTAVVGGTTVTKCCPSGWHIDTASGNCVP